MTDPGESLPPPRRDASMSLLVDAATDTVDPGYAMAAARRAHPHADVAVSRRITVLVGLLAAVLGLGTVWAARELRAPEPDALRARSLLEQEIERRTGEAADLQARNSELGAEVDALSSAALEGNDELIRDLAASGLLAGTVAAQGAGLRVTLTDSARAASGDPDAADERVQDIDLQILTNGLWAAGAEAVTVNGHRLTAVSAIRSAGEAVLVDLAPLVGPYVVEAVGDPEAMEVALARTAAARHVALLRETYSIGVSIASVDALVLPASPVPTLRFAVPLETNGLATGSADVPWSSPYQGETT